MKPTRNLACALALGLTVAGVSAQTQRSSISLVPPNPAIHLIERLINSKDGGNRVIGTVIDSRRLPIAKSHVQLRNLLTGGIVSETIANDLGEYTFPLVEPGTYVAELQIAGAVAALSEAATLGGGELVQTLIQLPGRWDLATQAVVPDIDLAQFVGISAADSMSGDVMANAANHGVTPVDPGEPVSAQR